MWEEATGGNHFWEHDWQVRQLFQGILATVTRTRRIIVHRVAYQWNPHLTWENSSQILTEIKMETNRLYDKECCPPPSSTRINSLAATIQYNPLWKEVMEKVRVDVALWENWQNLPSHT